MLQFRVMTVQYKTECNNCGHTMQVGSKFTYVPQGKWKLCNQCVPQA